MLKCQPPTQIMLWEKRIVLANNFSNSLFIRLNEKYYSWTLKNSHLTSYKVENYFPEPWKNQSTINIHSKISNKIKSRKEEEDQTIICETLIELRTHIPCNNFASFSSWKRKRTKTQNYQCILTNNKQGFHYTLLSLE